MVLVRQRGRVPRTLGDEHPAHRHRLVDRQRTIVAPGEQVDVRVGKWGHKPEIRRQETGDRDRETVEP